MCTVDVAYEDFLDFEFNGGMKVGDSLTHYSFIVCIACYLRALVVEKMNESKTVTIAIFLVDTRVESLLSSHS